MEMESYSYSQVRSFLGCEMRWFFDKVLGIRRVEARRAPQMGQVIHEAIEARIRGNDAEGAIAAYLGQQFERLEPHFSDVPSLAEDWEVLVGEVEKHALRIVDGWTAWIDLDDWETVETVTHGPLIERRFIRIFDLPNINPFSFTFIVDWVAKQKSTGLTWLIDWKSKAAFDNDDWHALNLQKMVYQYLLFLEDVDVDGSRIAQIRSKAPSEPKINKNGDVSRAAISTTWEIYEAAVIAAGKVPSDYEDMKAKLPPPDYWYQWLSAFRTHTECHGAWEQIVLPAITRMQGIKANQWQPVRNLGAMDCKTMCNMEMPCLETLKGRDLDSVIDFGYERSEDVA